MMENSLHSTEVWVLPSKTEQDLSSQVHKLKTFENFMVSYRLTIKVYEEGYKMFVSMVNVINRITNKTLPKSSYC